MDKKIEPIGHWVIRT